MFSQRKFSKEYLYKEKYRIASGSLASSSLSDDRVVTMVDQSVKAEKKGNEYLGSDSKLKQKNLVGK